MSPAEKLRRVEALNETVLQLAAARLKQEHPGIDDRELRLRLASLWLDAETMQRVFAWPPGPMTLAEPIAVTLEVTAALDKLGVDYLVGGSFASSVYGVGS